MINFKLSNVMKHGLGHINFDLLFYKRFQRVLDSFDMRDLRFEMMKKQGSK